MSNRDSFFDEDDEFDESEDESVMQQMDSDCSDS